MSLNSLCIWAQAPNWSMFYKEGAGCVVEVCWVAPSLYYRQEQRTTTSYATTSYLSLMQRGESCSSCGGIFKLYFFTHFCLNIVPLLYQILYVLNARSTAKGELSLCKMFCKNIKRWQLKRQQLPRETGTHKHNKKRSQPLTFFAESRQEMEMV